MKKTVFNFIIGYHGDSAVVDKRALKANSSLTSRELADKGLFKSAFCDALYDNDQESMQYILNLYNEQSGSAYKSIDQLKLLFGVYTVPDEIQKTAKI
ncbi:hypothetical protein [Spirochaeta isovalerica]|uniref:Uncharacterized protein n=1 Tax=Spirochaeta isovalerica TaxID=150 RepID=A0A841REJ2_9SPIO|nr:hypothetical protein [Spirochaeta isovalerica]MBB6482495.1 hypothetical protein [Spirochaeta isovalerica]